MTIERRTASEQWPDEDMEVRVADGGTGLHFTGYAIRFGVPSEQMVGFDGEMRREYIEESAADKSLAELSNRSPIKAFLNHNTDIVLGSTYRSAGLEPTLALTKDSRGVIADIDFPDNHWGRYAADAVKRKDITTMSFGFQLDMRKVRFEPGIQAISELRLREVSPVTAWAAYPQTSASVRHLAEALGETDEALLQAFRVLTIPDGTLTEEQHDLLQRVIASRTIKRFIAPDVAERLARLEAIKRVA